MSGFEKRGVKLPLLQSLRDAALRRNSARSYWSLGRVSARLIGNHEILKQGNRWTAESTLGPSSTLTFGSKSSLIDLLRGHHFDSPHPELGLSYQQVVGDQATLFLSFAYSDNFIELVDAIEVFFEEHSDMSVEHTFLWFDMVVNNQLEAADHDFDWWATTFRTAVQQIGHTLVFLSPALNPSLLTRAWCLYEISCSKKISVVLSRSEVQAFQDGPSKGLCWH
jgi:hypothetical protein